MSGIRVFIEDSEGYPVIESLPYDLVEDKLPGMRPSKGGYFELITDADAGGVVLYDSCFTLKLNHKILRTDMDDFLNSLTSAWKTNNPG